MNRIKSDKLAIIGAVYSKNYFNSVLICKCVENWIQTYNEANIVLIDNNSLNKEYINMLINKYENLYIIENLSEKFKYEYGAYKLGIEFIDAPYYFFLQCTTYFNKKIDYKKYDASPFIFCKDHDNYLNCKEFQLAKELYKSSWEDNFFVFGNNFFCNKNFSIGFYNIILSKIPITNKIESCAAERITGEFIFTHCKIIHVIEKFIYKNKIYTGNFKKKNLLIGYDMKNYINDNNINIHNLNKEETCNTINLLLEHIKKEYGFDYFLKISMNND